MKRGDVVLVRFPHPSGQRDKKRPAVVVQSGTYGGIIGTVVIAEVTKNLTMKDDPACLFIDVSAPEGKATGLLVDSVVSSLSSSKQECKRSVAGVEVLRNPGWGHVRGFGVPQPRPHHHQVWNY